MREIRRVALPVALTLSMALIPACGTSETDQQASVSEEAVTETAPAFASWDAEEQVSVYRDSMDSTESVTV